MSGIGMQVRYRSGTMVTHTVGMIEQERQRGSGFEYFVRWADGRSGWYLARNLAF